MADLIWLQKLKKRFGQSLSSVRITPERPNFTGSAGYNTEMDGPDHGFSGYSLPSLSPEMMALSESGSLVDPHLAAAAGGPGWGSGMAPSTMTKVPASAAAGGGFKRVLKHLGAMESPGPDWSLQAQNVGVRSPWLPTNIKWSAVGRPDNVFGVGGTMFDWKKKRTA